MAGGDRKWELKSMTIPNVICHRGQNAISPSLSLIITLSRTAQQPEHPSRGKLVCCLSRCPVPGRGTKFITHLSMSLGDLRAHPEPRHPSPFEIPSGSNLVFHGPFPEGLRSNPPGRACGMLMRRLQSSWALSFHRCDSPQHPLGQLVFEGCSALFLRSLRITGFSRSRCLWLLRTRLVGTYALRSRGSDTDSTNQPGVICTGSPEAACCSGLPSHEEMRGALPFASTTVP